MRRMEMQKKPDAGAAGVSVLVGADVETACGIADGALDVPGAGVGGAAFADRRRGAAQAEVRRAACGCSREIAAPRPRCRQAPGRWPGFQSPAEFWNTRLLLYRLFLPVAPRSDDAVLVVVHDVVADQGVVVRTGRVVKIAAADHDPAVRRRHRVVGDDHVGGVVPQVDAGFGRPVDDVVRHRARRVDVDALDRVAAAAGPISWIVLPITSDLMP